MNELIGLTSKENAEKLFRRYKATRTLQSAAAKADVIMVQNAPLDSAPNQVFFRVTRAQLLRDCKKRLKDIAAENWYLAWDLTLWIGQPEMLGRVQALKEKKQKLLQELMREVDRKDSLQ